MFQYAFGRALSIDNKMPLVLDTSQLKGKRLSETSRSFALDDLSVMAQVGLPLWQAAMLRYSSKKHGFKKLIANSVFPIKHIIEDGLAYQANIGNTASSGSSYFHGYWQCERYFLRHRTILLDDFRLRVPLTLRSKTLLTDIRRSACAVALHIRRGDYVTSASASAVHGTCTADYYHRAMMHMKKTLGCVRFFVFSDDIAWAQENLGSEHELVFADYSTSVNACEDMHLIRACQHQIIANSSFSWWGAWLNRNPDKIVISPMQWFKAEHMDSGDLIPAEWIKLQ